MYNNIVGASAIGINIESTAKGGILCTAHIGRVCSFCITFARLLYAYRLLLALMNYSLGAQKAQNSNDECIQQYSVLFRT